MYLEGLINFLAILTIAQDSEMNLDQSTFNEEFIDMYARWSSVMETLSDSDSE